MIIEKDELIKKILNTSKKLNNIVSSTLGPQGKNVIINDNGKVISTKDGVTVAKNFALDDPAENTILKILKDVSINTEKMSGDGTTTATLLMHHLLQECYKYIIAGFDRKEIMKGIDEGYKIILEQLQQYTKQISSKEDIKNIAKVSANGDEEIGNIVSNAIDIIGKNGNIVIENNYNSQETKLILREGFRLESGYVSESFKTDENSNFIKYDNPLVLVCDYKLDNLDELLPLLEIVAREARPFIIISDTLGDKLLSAMVLNTVRGSMKITPIYLPKFGKEKRDLAKDLALYLNAALLSKEKDLKLKDVKLVHLGTCKTIEIHKNYSIFIEGNGKQEDIEKRIEVLKNEIKEEENIDECERISERISRLNSAVAIIQIGGSSELEINEKKFRLEDALLAVKASQEMGYIIGGGIVLYRISEEMKSIKMESENKLMGIKIIRNVILRPFIYLTNSCNINYQLVYEDIDKNGKDFGFDAFRNQVVDLQLCGIMEPVKISISALFNAISVVKQLLITENLIIK